MKKILFFGITLWVLIFISVFILLNLLDKEIKKEKAKIGTYVVIERDSLLIVNYLPFRDSYTLSNGAIVSIDLVEKLQK